MSSELLKVKGLGKSFNIGKRNEVNVLKGVDLTLKEGDFISLMGPSGCGKSTLLNILGGLIPATFGSIELNNTSYENLSDSEMTKIRASKIGWVFQSFALINNLTAIENVMIPMNLIGVSEEESVERAKKLLTDVNLQDKMDRLPDDLSGGQNQRIAIARSLANNPGLILADEPTGNLDTKNGLDIIELFKKLAKENNKTVLMVTHDAKLANSSDKVLFLRNGILSERLKKELK